MSTEAEGSQSVPSDIQPGSGTSEPSEETSPQASEIDELRGSLAKANERAEDLLGKWQRVQADFINYKRRVEQERDQLTKMANFGLISRIIPILDDFDRAFLSLPSELHRLTWLEGVLLIQRKLEYILEQEGLTRIETQGKDFDPNVHEAVLVEEGASLHEGKVVAELQRGYKLHDRVLRSALVKVGQAPVQTDEE